METRQKIHRYRNIHKKIVGFLAMRRMHYQITMFEAKVFCECIQYRIPMTVREYSIRMERYRCPRCKQAIEFEYCNFCKECGQRLSWYGTAARGYEEEWGSEFWVFSWKKRLLICPCSTDTQVLWTVTWTQSIYNSRPSKQIKYNKESSSKATYIACETAWKLAFNQFRWPIFRRRTIYFRCLGHSFARY